MLSFSKKTKNNIKSFGYYFNERYPDRSNLNYVGTNYCEHNLLNRKESWR
ncbi:hypothetical protein [Clostridium sp.]